MLVSWMLSFVVVGFILHHCHHVRLGVNDCKAFWWGTPGQHCRWQKKISTNKPPPNHDSFFYSFLFENIFLLWSKYEQYCLQIKVPYLLGCLVYKSVHFSLWMTFHSLLDSVWGCCQGMCFLKILDFSWCTCYVWFAFCFSFISLVSSCSL